ncbi:HI1506-related protein [Pararhodospirillum oryzae]|uniref:Mu-like prophage FluMu N-terminal domain-containing protein n=1 Tax=Pararhodospirillum oryzae TaxID=478448 RepID=A0A512HA01_9PROT|nr:HI1506-related protein [Pararhodospirillum oryzae]GEO82275.1 hypothetical protein ROR02_24060 [Pararhodospirillum oryzae]
MAGVILRVSARRPGFRRAGRAWDTAPTDLNPETLTAEQVAALKAEPMLVVEEIALPPDPTAPKGKGAPAPKEG